MNIKQTEILLEKINSLYKSIRIGGGNMASIERDLMLSYIRQLYEAFIEQESTDYSVGDKPGIKAPQTKKADQAPKAFETIKPVEQPKKKHIPPKIIEIPDSLKELSASRSKQAISTAKITPTLTPQPKATVKPPLSKRPLKAGLEVLFEFRQAKELSEKLSSRPVKDLGNAMAINDRLLYMNDLFGKDNDVFKETLTLLNKFENLEQAKGLLVDLAGQYSWTEEDKLETAKAFINLIRRRYI